MKSKIILATSLVIITVVFMSIYTIGQQTIRLSANMPQIQVAQDTARELNNGSTPASVIPSGPKVNIATSSAGFVIIYDKTGKTVTGSGELDGTIPTIPYGVLQNTSTSDYHAVTWQPKPEVRIASIEVRADNYYVLAGRSLDEPEKLIATIGRLTLLGYAGSCFVLLLGWFLYRKAPN